MSFPLETLAGFADALSHSNDSGTVNTLNTLSTCAYVLAFNDTVRRNNFLFHVLHVSCTAELATIHALVNRCPNRPITQYAREVFVDMGFPPEVPSTTTQIADVLFSCSAARILDLNAIGLSCINARALPHVTTAVLNRVSFTDGHNITNFLHFLPSLQTLSVAWVEYGCFNDNTDPLPVNLCNLTVTFNSGARNHRRDTYIAWLAQSLSDISPLVGRLTLTNITDASVNDVVVLLDRTGAHLDSLSLTMAYGHHYADSVLSNYADNHVLPVILYEDANGVPSNQLMT